MENDEDEEAKKKKMALVPYRWDMSVWGQILRENPSSMLNYIFSLENALRNLQLEIRNLEIDSKRNVCQTTAKRTQTEKSLESIPTRESTPTPTQQSSDDLSSTSFVSVLAPSIGSQEAPSQNTSSANLTPAATKQNSLAILPPQALPEPCITSLGNSFDIIQSPRETENYAISSEDVSVEVMQAHHHRGESSNSTNEDETHHNSGHAISSVEGIARVLPAINIHANLTTEHESTLATEIENTQQAVPNLPAATLGSEGKFYLLTCPENPCRRNECLDCSESRFQGQSQHQTHDVVRSETFSFVRATHPYLPRLGSMRESVPLPTATAETETSASSQSSQGATMGTSTSANCNKICVFSRMNSNGNDDLSSSYNEEHHRPLSTTQYSTFRTQLYFGTQIFERQRTQMPENFQENLQVLENDERPLISSSTQSNDSLHVNINADEFIANEDALEEIVDAGDDAVQPSSSSSSTESADGRGDAGNESSTQSPAEGQSTSHGSLSNLSHPNESINLGGKYGTLAVLLRPRPPSGHRYVISSNEVSSRRKNENRLPSWVPTYAQRIECILHQFLDEIENTLPVTEIGPTLDYIYVRIKGNPPTRLLEFDESSDSEESCIRSINSNAKKKSCLKVISREGNVGESRPKNLSWSQHVYVAKIPSQPADYDDNDRSKSRSCPGIYYVGEFSIGTCNLGNAKNDKNRKQGKRRAVVNVFKKVFHCIRCNSPPPPYVESTTDIRATDNFPSKRRGLSTHSTTPMIPISACSACNV